MSHAASSTSRSTIKGWAIMAYAVLSYLLFLVTFTVLVAFVGDLWAIRSTPRSWFLLDGTAARVAVDTALLLAFAVQHSVMARQGFKKWLTRYIPETAERATYVLATVMVLVPTMVFWQPLPGSFLQLEGPARMAMHGVLLLGFAIGLISTFLIDHFFLFGLKQGAQALRDGKSPDARFVTPLFYRWVRHPLMTGILIICWAMADVTVDRLFLALAMTGYIMVGIYFEERGLLRELGDVYRIYKKHVPSVIPGLAPAWPPAAADLEALDTAAEAA